LLLMNVSQAKLKISPSARWAPPFWVVAFIRYFRCYEESG